MRGEVFWLRDTECIDFHLKAIAVLHGKGHFPFTVGGPFNLWFHKKKKTTERALIL